MRTIKGSLLLFFLTISICAFSQQAIHQTIRGTIIDKDSNVPLIGANIMVLGATPALGSSTDIDGHFKIQEVPIGRVNIEVSYLGYETVNLNEILLTSGKELILNIELQESTTNLEEVVVKAKLDKTQALNEMATVSARSFSVEETSRYAGSFYDPARMAQAYAGVSVGGADDLSNAIIIRGNSPRGVLWRLEGIETPNPNHFGAIGGSGGGISMLSSSTLTNSDFYTGAFPSEFGNALSGVFDLNLRKGNNEKREYAFMIGALGIEASAEGPINRATGSSYLINYRYSTLGALSLIGLNPVGDILPEYQDLSFKINLPTANVGTFAIYGLGGKNTASYVPDADSLKWNGDDDEWGFSEEQRTGTLGISHRILLSDKSYLKTVAAASTNRYTENDYFLDKDNDYNKIVDETLPYTNNSVRLSSTYNHKFNARNSLRAGIVLSYMKYDFQYTERNEETGEYRTYFDKSGETHMVQAHAQWKYRINEALTLNSGMHFTRFGLNGDFTIEPRAALRWKLNDRQSVSVATGLHSRPEPIAFYFTETGDDPNNPFPNKNLRMSRAIHSVIGYDHNLSANLRLKAEVYFQQLYDIPVENIPGSTRSILNAEDLWDILSAEAAINEGKGRNYGIDLTLEKFFSNQYYFMLTGSFFQSKYTPINGKTYSTRYNGNYQLNLLSGKEFKVGRKGNKIFGINGKFILSGGNRYTPIDLEKSRELGRQIRKYDQPFASKAGAYYRFDLGVSYKINSKKMTHTILLDIQNVTNRLNIYSLYYNENTSNIDQYTQTGLFPVFNYRIEF